jgi:hypothetical protein
MERREFLQTIPSLAWLWAGLLTTPTTAEPGPPPARTYLQNSPLAGFQFYDGPASWNALAEGDLLELTREPHNPHDGSAVAVHWKGRKLGYLPRGENATAARLMDQGLSLHATLASKRESRNPWERILLDVWIGP